MTLPNRTPAVQRRTAAARLIPRSIFSYWRLTWRRLTAVFGPPLLVLAVGIIAYGGTTRIAAARAEGQRSSTVTDAADELVSLLTQAETGQRGFLITNDENYLEPYTRALESIAVVTDRLRAAALSAGSSSNTRLAVDSLEMYSNEKLRELAQTVQLRRTSGARAALAVVNTNHGRDVMLAARRLAASVRREEAQRLDARSAAEVRYAGQVTFVVLLGTGAAFLIALLVNVLLARDAAIQTRLAAERDEALGAITHSNLQLEEQTRRLEEQAAELQQQAQELEAGNEELKATSEELEEQSAIAEQARNQATGILESIGDGFFALDHDWRFIYLNENVQPLLGRSSAELLGLNMWEAFPEAIGSSLETAYRRAVRDQVSVGLEEYFPPLDKWFQVRAYPWRRGLAVYFTDVSARVRAERSFRALAETMPQLVWSTSVTGDTEYFNGRWLAYTGRAADDSNRHDWQDALHASDRTAVAEKWERSFRSGDPFEAECRLRRESDGSYRWFLCRALPLRDENGTITHWFGTCTDVHDQRRATEGLSVLAEASAVLAMSLDTEDSIRKVAQLAVPRLGDWCTVDLLAPDGTLRRIATVHDDPGMVAIADELNRRYPPSPEDAGGVMNVVRTGEVESEEITDEMIVATVPDIARRRLLLALHLRSYVIAPLIIDAKPAGALSITSAESGHFMGPSDIARVHELARRMSLALENARLFAETVAARDEASLSYARLRESEAKLVLSMEAGGLGAWEWDIVRNIVAWSPQTERMHGVAEGTFPGTVEAFSSYIHPDDRARVEHEIARTLAERTPTYYIKYRFVRGDGALRWLESFARLAIDANGNPHSLLGVSHDVTDREELLEAEQQARRDAEAANAAKAIFLTTMSHELRTPLNAVSGYADLLEMGVRGPVTDLQREDLRRIRRASQHLLALINDILNYARLEAGSVELHLSTVTLADALAEMEALVAPQLEAKGVEYEYRPCNDALRVRVDREKLDQILLNLVGNAVKFTDAGGRITLHCAQSDGRAEVVVTDTGRGIPRGKLESIFDPFVQVDRHLTPERQQGVGLGLAISRDLARAMSGDITVQSDAGRGATFVLTLPLADAARVSGALGKVEGVQ
jgi:PAS domain S-box-containing protein